MYGTTALLVTAILCAAAGAAGGWLLRRLFDPAERRIAELTQKLHDADLALRNYRREVTEHFRGTAERVNRLTEDYRELHSHLSEGAMGLCDSPGDGTEAPLLTSLSGGSRPGNLPAAPPLDYAPPRVAAGNSADDLDLERIHDN